MEKMRRTLSEEQQQVLSNPNALTTFLYLLDGASSNEDLARRTGMKPLETSVYLERMKEVGLVGLLRHVSIGKNKQTLYQVLEPDVDFSAIVPSLSASGALDLVYSKVQEDVQRLESNGVLRDHSEIRYGQIRVRKGAFLELQKMLASIEQFIQEQEVADGEESLNFLLIGYKTDGQDQNH